MRVEPIVIRGYPTEAIAATRAWLQGVDPGAAWLVESWKDVPDRGGLYRAAWLGAPSTLGALGVHRDDGVVDWKLASVLVGRSAMGHGERVLDAEDVSGVWRWDERRRLIGRRPDGVESRHLTLPAPEWVTELWIGSHPNARSEIAEAMLVSGDAAVEHIRRTVPLVPRRGRDGADVPGLAHGLAAAAIVWPSPDHADQRPQVRVLMFAAERSDGALLTPDWSAIDQPDVGTEVAAVAHAKLGDELAKLGYSIERDPHAGPSLRRHHLDREHGAESPRPDAGAHAVWKTWLHAHEDLILVQARAREPGAHPNLQNAVEVLRERIEPLEAQANYFNDLSPAIGAARNAPDNELADSTALDGLRGRLGDQRVDALARGTAPLTEWLLGQHASWVEARSAELGTPGAAVPGAARIARLNEVHRERAEQRLTAAVAEEAALTSRADHATSAQETNALFDLAQAEHRESDRARAELEHINTHARQLPNLDDLIARDGDHIRRAAAYEDAQAIHRAADIARQPQHATEPLAHQQQRTPAAEAPGLEVF
jgi:hypothetical protein